MEKRKNILKVEPLQAYELDFFQNLLGQEQSRSLYGRSLLWQRYFVANRPAVTLSFGAIMVF
jgi:hypothetical protein